MKLSKFFVVSVAAIAAVTSFVGCSSAPIHSHSVTTIYGQPGYCPNGRPIRYYNPHTVVGPTVIRQDAVIWLGAQSGSTNTTVYGQVQQYGAPQSYSPPQSAYYPPNR